MSNIKIVRGNTFAVRMHVKALRFNGTEITDFDLSECTDIVVSARTSYTKTTLAATVLDGNYLRIMYPAELQKLGCHGFDVTGAHNGTPWRFFNTDVLEIVETNADASIPESSIIDEDYYSVDEAVVIMSDTYDDTELRADIAALEGICETLANNISTLQTTTQALASSIESLSTSVNGSIQTLTTNFNNAVASLEASISSTNTTLTNLINQKESALTSAINALAARVTPLEGGDFH